MAIRPFKRAVVTAATALSMTTLLATTAQAVPATLPHESMVTYTISPDGKVVAKADVKVNTRAKDTMAPITLSGDADGVVVAAGKKTKPANYKILRAQPGNKVWPASQAWLTAWVNQTEWRMPLAKYL